MPSSFYAAVVI
jgi:hypothetical protein